MRRTNENKKYITDCGCLKVIEKKFSNKISLSEKINLLKYLKEFTQISF
jgi:hypothetical protein